MYKRQARGYVAGTGDDYATYYSAEDLKTLQQDQQGYVTGIGITGSQDESGYIKVLTIYEGSPASAAGIAVSYTHLDRIARCLF